MGTRALLKDLREKTVEISIKYCTLKQKILFGGGIGLTITHFISDLMLVILSMKKKSVKTLRLNNEQRSGSINR